jgi:hypothetical protein
MFQGNQVAGDLNTVARSANPRSPFLARPIAGFTDTHRQSKINFIPVDGETFLKLFASLPGVSNNGNLGFPKLN